MQIYFCGASGVGKTTLAKIIAKKFGLDLIESVSRGIHKKLGIDLNTVTMGELYSLNHELGIQEKILVEQYQKEIYYKQTQMGFISDRFLDPIAYSYYYFNQDILSKQKTQYETYVSWVKESMLEKKAIVFFVKPTKEIFEIASQQSTRGIFLKWDDIIVLSGMIQGILEINQINYIPISTGSLVERDRLVTSTIKLLK